jgi:hypothetical protein
MSNVYAIGQAGKALWHSSRRRSRPCQLVVLGGAGLVMFGMVAPTRARILSAVDFKNNRYSPFVVAISVGFAMIPLSAPGFV